MKRKIFLLTWICAFVLAGQVSVVYLPVSAKEKPVERVCETWDQDWVERREFGLVAKNVTDVKIGTEGRSYWEVFLKQKGDNRVKEVDLFKKKKGQTVNYKLNVVIKRAKYYFPMISRCLYVDSKKRLLLTGKDECFLNLSSGHTTEKECKKSYHEHYNKVIRRKVNGNRCWYDKDMFAYVKNNRLYITGEIIDDSYEMCCGGSKERSFSMGRQIRSKK